MKEYIEREKDKYIKLSQALEVLDSCACWWAHERMERIPAAELAAGVQHREDDLERALAGLLLDVHRDAAAVVADADHVPVPSHGRLVEADVLAKRIKDEGRNQAEYYADRHAPVVMAYGDCYGKVQSAPTIIEAEEE